MRAQMYCGEEGSVRPGSAAPSLLQQPGGGGGGEGAPVPEAVLRHAGMFFGAEGTTRPGSAAPSGGGSRGGGRGAAGKGPDRLSAAFAAAVTGLGPTEPDPEGRYHGVLGGGGGGVISEEDEVGSGRSGVDVDGGYDVDEGGGDGATEDSSSWGGGGGRIGHGRSLSMDDSIGATSEEDGMSGGLQQHQQLGSALGSDYEEGEDNDSHMGGGPGGGFGHFIVTPLGVARAEVGDDGNLREEEAGDGDETEDTD